MRRFLLWSRYNNLSCGIRPPFFISFNSFSTCDTTLIHHFIKHGRIPYFIILPPALLLLIHTGYSYIFFQEQLLRCAMHRTLYSMVILPLEMICHKYTFPVTWLVKKGVGNYLPSAYSLCFILSGNNKLDCASSLLVGKIFLGYMITSNPHVLTGLYICVYIHINTCIRRWMVLFIKTMHWLGGASANSAN